MDGNFRRDAFWAHPGRRATVWPGLAPTARRRLGCQYRDATAMDRRLCLDTAPDRIGRAEPTRRQTAGH